MNKADREEAIPVIRRTMDALMSMVPTSAGRSGADVRRAVGDLMANIAQLLSDDAAGEPISECYEAARTAGVTLPQFYQVIAVSSSEAPTTLGAIQTKHSLVQFGLIAVCRVIIDMEFTSRQDVDRVREAVGVIFNVLEEASADIMDSERYRALVEMHASVIGYLIDQTRPLPRLVRFHFNRPLTTLVASYRLYDDANRADMLRAENKVVHPAFMRGDGLALSA